MARQTDQKRKARALADLMNGDQPAIVAERYGFPAGTVRQWKKRLVTPAVTSSVTAPVTARPAIERAQLDIAALVLDNLRAKLIATQKMAEHVTTATWLEKQNAADLATLFETIDRAAVAILDRMARGSRADDADGSASD